MSQRSIQAGPAATVIIRAGGTVQVAGHAGERVLASSESRWGLKLKRRGGIVEVHIGGSGEVQVPRDCSVKIYAGANVELRNIGGSATIYAGGQCVLRDVAALAHASAGAALDIECERIEGPALQCSAGRDLRLSIRDLPDAKLIINDLGGYREGVIGAGRVGVRLTAGGDAILATGQTAIASRPAVSWAQSSE